MIRKRKIYNHKIFTQKHSFSIFSFRKKNTKNIIYIRFLIDNLKSKILSHCYRKFITPPSLLLKYEEYTFIYSILNKIIFLESNLKGIVRRLKFYGGRGKFFVCCFHIFWFLTKWRIRVDFFILFHVHLGGSNPLSSLIPLCYY